MNIIEANITAIKNAWKPWGRATRSEFWWVTAVLFGSVVLAGIIDETLLANVNHASEIYTVATIAFIAVYVPWLILFVLTLVRRLHDMDMSGWYALLLLLGVIGLVVLGIICGRQGTLGPNRFGLDPRYTEIDEITDIFG